MRGVRPDDAEALGRLMYEAYQGTVDYEGETREESIGEVHSAIGGKYGEFLSACSFLIEESSQPACATLVTLWEGRPLLAFVMTRPDQSRLGMATHLVQRTINALLDQGYEELELFVTRTNEAAIRIYERLGFRDVEGWSLPDVD
ncbi:MAG: GNAT family N-acetyltransferase [Actinomycetota bacterium]